MSSCEGWHLHKPFKGHSKGCCLEVTLLNKSIGFLGMGFFHITCLVSIMFRVHLFGFHGCFEKYGLPWWFSSKDSTCNARDEGWIPGLEYTLEKEAATHYGFLAWEIPCTEEPGRQQFLGLQSWTWLSDWTTATVTLVDLLIDLKSQKQFTVRPRGSNTDEGWEGGSPCVCLN